MTPSQTCGPGQRRCWTAPDWVPGRPDPQPYCCPYPEQQWSCGDRANGYKCKDQCPPVSPGSRKRQRPTWSGARYPDGRPQRYNCCPVPDFDPVDGECLPSCQLVAGRGAHRCGKTCCVRGQRCKSGKCQPCPPGEEACAPEDGGPSNCCCTGGHARCGSKCCPARSRCADPSRGRCEKCASGTEECGSTCCKRGSYCCNSKKGICCTDKDGSCCGESSPICCEKRDCCQVALSRLPVCCPQGETCADRGNSAGLVLPGRRTKVCCEADRVVRLSGATICCAPGSLSLGGRLILPPGGGGGLCCKASQTCGSGRSITCCGPTLTCQGGRCV
jgi:hypothetical protein